MVEKFLEGITIRLIGLGGESLIATPIIVDYRTYNEDDGLFLLSIESVMVPAPLFRS